jgi:lipoprotein-anchoring transpeptidase ErfK/SrfK
MSSIQDKTIRPGSLKGYAYYYGSRRPVPQRQTKPARAAGRRGFLAVALLVVLGGFWIGFRGAGGNAPAVSGKQPAVTVQAPPTGKCAGNTLDRFIKISIGDRHLWACQGDKKVFDSAMISGLRGHPEDETPVGTYKIYAKTTDTTLTGADSRGSWSDPVYYWMPFLDNQYGTYGFHDATWRPDSAFGNVSPDSDDASHGCIELPLASSKWLYNWAPVGTTVSVES